MKPFTTICVAAIVAVIAAYGTVKTVAVNSTGSKQENAFQRITRSNTIKCGYYSWAPFISKDPNTGKFSGVFYDMFNQIAENAGLKVEWAEEVGLGEYPQALATGRIDAYCTPLAQLGTRARAVDFTDAIGYFPIYAFVRKGDTRFDSDLTKINDAKVKISGIDGEGTVAIAAKVFPKAQIVSLPQNSNGADMLNNVVTGKADITLTDYTTMNQFLEKNPGALVPVAHVKPVGVYGGAFSLAQGNDVLRQALNWSIRELLYTEQIGAIYDKNNIAKNVVLRPAMPYEMK